MDIKNTKQTEFDGILNLPKTAADRVLDKETGFYEDTKIKAIEQSLIDIYKKLNPFFMQNNGLSHNGIFRGKNLGSSVTPAQFKAIKAGTFDDMYIGDYWAINGINWRIAAFDYWWKKGDTATMVHHVAIVPDKALLKCSMGTTTENAYGGCDFRTGANGNTGMEDITTIINNAFGSDHILNHREIFAKTRDTRGVESAWDWYDSKIELLSERMVFGSKMYEPTYMGYSGGSMPAVTTIDTTQLPLFFYAPQFIICTSSADNSRGGYWLRNVFGGSFCIVDYNGRQTDGNPSSTTNVRPYFALYSN